VVNAWRDGNHYMVRYRLHFTALLCLLVRLLRRNYHGLGNDVTATVIDLKEAMLFLFVAVCIGKFRWRFRTETPTPASRATASTRSASPRPRPNSTPYSARVAPPSRRPLPTPRPAVAALEGAASTGAAACR
jgi:hypothetical protein